MIFMLVCYGLRRFIVILGMLSGVIPQPCTLYNTLPEHVGRVMHYSVSIGGSRYLKVTINNEHLDVHVILRLC